jgi:hypothetical protein
MVLSSLTGGNKLLILNKETRGGFNSLVMLGAWILSKERIFFKKKLKQEHCYVI